MQINIEVNEEQFKEITDKSIKDLPPEKLQEVVLDGIRKYLTESNAITELLTTKGGYYSNYTQPTQFLENLMMKSTNTDELNNIRDEMIKYLRNNYDVIFR